MTLEQARGIIATLAVFFPRPKIPDETRAAWAVAIVEHDAIDALTAVNDLARTSRFLPSLAELLTAIGEARRDRIARLPALPDADDAPAPGSWPFERWLREISTPELRRMVNRGSPALAAKYGITLERLAEDSS